MISASKKITAYKILAAVLLLIFYFNAALFDNLPIIDLRAVVTVMGIDKTESGIKVSAHILLPIAGGGSEFIQALIEADGENLSEAIDKLNVTSGEKVEVSRCGMMFFGRGICDEGILNEVKTIISTGTMNAGLIILTSDTLEAHESLSKALKMNKESSSNVNSFISYFENSLYMPDLTLIKFLTHSVGESHASYIPCIEIEEPNEGDSSGGGEEEGGGGGGSGSKEQGSGGSQGGEAATIKSMSKIAIFKNGIRVGLLDEDSSQGLIWSRPRSKKGYIMARDFEYEGENCGTLSGDVISKSCDMQVSFKDDKPFVKFVVGAEISMRERHKIMQLLDYGSEDSQKIYCALGEHFSARIKDMIQKAVESSKYFDTDFLNIKYKFCRLKAKEISQYNQRFDSDFLRDLEYDIVVKTNVM